MAELRRDPIAGRWVILSGERSARPNDFGQGGSAVPCPFCAGNEEHTLSQLAAYPADGPWQARVVPNRYPALDPLDGASEPASLPSEPLFERTRGAGYHEVIVESPDHLRDFAALPPDRARLVATVWRDRIAAAQSDPRIGYALIFRNHGRMAGASREHVHSQLLASPEVPAGISAAAGNARAHHAATGRCIWCDLIAAETAGAAPRLIAQDVHTVTVTAFAPRFAYETWILPRQHAHDFGATSDAGCHALADAFGAALRRLQRAMGDVPYNMGLHTAPRGALPASHHWRLEIYPRLHHLAGYEWGSGSAIVSVTPEEAATQLR